MFYIESDPNPSVLDSRALQEIERNVRVYVCTYIIPRTMDFRR